MVTQSQARRSALRRRPFPFNCLHNGQQSATLSGDVSALRSNVEQTAYTITGLPMASVMVISLPRIDVGVWLSSAALLFEPVELYIGVGRSRRF
jgi:hypothetical protein